MQTIEINEVKKIEREIQVDASQTDSMIYHQRGDWYDLYISAQAEDQLLNWLFDHCERVEGHYCWSILLNGRRGYLFCEYDRNCGIEAIHFFYRYPRKRAAKPVTDPECERFEKRLQS